MKEQDRRMCGAWILSSVKEINKFIGGIIPILQFDPMKVANLVCLPDTLQVPQEAYLRIYEMKVTELIYSIRRKTKAGKFAEFTAEQFESKLVRSKKRFFTAIIALDGLVWVEIVKKWLLL